MACPLPRPFTRRPRTSSRELLRPVPTRTDPMRAARSRMLAAVALAGAATLLAACASGPDTQEPGSPPVAITGADPVPIDDALLAQSGLFDGFDEAAVAVRWMQPGESIAVVLGGSGSGGECIPQPHAAGLDPTDSSIVVRFDPPDPEAICTRDYRLHGWELGLAEPIDASQIVQVRLANMNGADEIIEVELGPDDLLVTETADPQPSEIPDAGDVPEPEAIPSEQLPDVASIIDPMQDPGVAVRWIEPGVSLAVMLGGSGSEACVPQPVGAVSTGPGTIEIAFDYPAGDRDCSADLRLYGWRIPLAEAVSATLPVEVTVTGAAAAGATVELTLDPGDTLSLP